MATSTDPSTVSRLLNLYPWGSPSLLQRVLLAAVRLFSLDIWVFSEGCRELTEAGYLPPPPPTS